ncbi:Exonuclease, RNase T/DNA polymerase III [Kalmanozyma brasiliensis GHG001]|uniref:SAP domain-containing protein n=1 Tax=Kalmanozyma brasiliensis (strain GHG001) TaxID=1365824 RepID=V5EU27_KALBG|nr:Exonuclease, RNase T/DNA polymerase III [Kalmanozyma brasiliensis GHG001]EST06598.1 Exonuclease, RNase T/DNA polymerase III [Kalmanozyma brasiliensis GHG001]
MASSLTVEELRSRLHDFGLDTKGKKADLRLRLKKAIRNASDSPPTGVVESRDENASWEPEFDTFLVLDVEATCESTRKYRNLQHGYETGSFQYPNEIIEFPVVLLRWNAETQQLDTTGTFHSFVRPTFRPHLTRFCRDLTGVTQSQVDAAPTWPKVVQLFFQFLRTHDLVEDTSTPSTNHLHNYRLRRGVTWINHGPADLRDFVIKQCWISGHARDKDAGAPPIFLRGPLVDIRRGIASLFKWEQELKAEQNRAVTRAATPLEFGGEDGFQVISPASATVVKEDPRTTGLSPYDQSLAGLLELLNIGPFQGRQHSGLDDTRNIARLAIEAARRISLAAKGEQVLLTKNFESVDGQMEASAAVMELDKRTALTRARQMEKLVLRPNVRLDGYQKRFFWMGKCAGESPPCLPSDSIDHSPPKMSVAASVLGYAGLGFLTRCYALGLQKRNIFENLGGHAMLMSAFGALGYYVHGLEGRQLELIAHKKEQILKNRERLAGGSSPSHDDE